MKKMNDLEPFEHGEEGTHYACQEMSEKYGGKVSCCGCNKHECMTKTRPTPDTTVEEILKEIEKLGRNVQFGRDIAEAASQGGKYTRYDTLVGFNLSELKAFLSSALIRVEIESLQKGYAQGYDDMKNIVKEELAKLKSSKIQSEEKKV